MSTFRILIALLSIAGFCDAANATEWQVAPYGQPAVEKSAGTIRISGKEPPAGLYFRRDDLDKDTNYRLEISGLPEQGSATIRVRRDEGPFDYNPAPAGTLCLTITGAKRLELLIYSDSAYSYRARIALHRHQSCGDQGPGGWSVAKYGAPGISRFRHEIMGVAGDTPPSGVFFRRDDLDPQKNYRLEVSGFRRHGPVTLRMRHDDGSYDYQPAPDGRRILQIRGTKRLEALFYGDAPFSYRVHLSLRECPDCLGEQATVAGWKTARYGAPQLVQQVGNAVRLTGSGDPSGLHFQRDDLDRNKRYKLEISGVRQAGTAYLRLQHDDGPVENGTAPEGKLELEVADTSRIDVLIYGNSYFSYRTSMVLRECPDCDNDERLRNVVRAAIPGIDDALKTDLLPAVRKLLLWTARTVDLGGNLPQFANLAGAFDLMPASQLYETVWKKDEGGAMCGGFAVFFQKLLASFGVPSFNIDIGFPGTTLTHVTTLVPVTTNSITRFYVFDPTFGGTYLAPDGSYVDLASALSGTVPAHFAADPVRRSLILENRSLAGARRLFHKFGQRPSCHASRDVKGYTVCDNFAFDERMLSAEWAPLLRKQSVSPHADLILTFLRRNVLFSGASGDVKLAFDALLSNLPKSSQQAN